MDRRRIDDLERARAAQRDDARPDVVERVHGAGRLTARERLALVLDEGSTVEYGAIAARAADGAWVAEAGGVDVIGTIDGQTVIASSTDFTDRGGGYGAGRLERLFALAAEHRWPVVFFVDGGGSRARHPRTGRGDLELTGPFGRFQIFDGIAELSGWVPTVAIVSGPSFAGHASLAGFSDVVIATGGSSIGMGGPPMVEAALGVALSPSELAGVEMHDRTGGVDVLVADEHEAVAAARRYLSFWSEPDRGGHGGSQPAPAVDTVADLVPHDGPYDVVAVVEAIVDAESLLVLRPRFAPSVVTALARIGGRSVGVIASQPTSDDGAIDEDGATKAARMVELCDAYGYPIVALIDTPGTIVRRTGNGGGAVAGVSRWHTRAIMAHHHRSTPLVAVQIGRGGGLGPAIIGGLASGRSVPVAWWAWPTTTIGEPDGYAAVRHQDAYDDVIAPAETRPRLCRLLDHLPPRPERTVKTRPIDSW